ncbi:hypothetical protein HIM_10366 [Hirsutella minnesotensis 3608]|uniref:Amidase domain-containing protein n=1 Tax=Hirsutella minnesotensis 3608 TaxID=1043627 RepID=A0A0F7ZX79_9HYPO|nr:hypothetical protein HIM_10366 [Hirsutella minnesotensis 3608]
MKSALVTCLVGSSQYLLHPEKLGTIQETIKPDALLPVTLLETREIFGDNLEATLRSFGARDDVFVEDFGVILIEKPNSSNATAGRDGLRRGGGRRRPDDGSLYHLSSSGGDVKVMAGGAGGDSNNTKNQGTDFSKLPSGPYFLHGPNLYQAWRLYDDDAGAFAASVLPENVTHPTLSFETLNVLADSAAAKSIAVPSRLYFPDPSRDKPLASRSWRQLYGVTPAGATAGLARRLLELGAIVVGKTASSQLTAGREWIDEQAPWNPRGDGYRRQGAGEVGAAAAVATYDWLRAAFGIDGLGNVRGPAAAHGLFSLRTTPGAIPLDGSRSSSSSFDSVAVVDRNLIELSNVVSTVLGDSTPDTTSPLPKRIVYPMDVGHSPSKELQDLSALFLRSVESIAGVKAERVNLTATWAESPPAEAQSQGLQEYLKDASFCLATFRVYWYEFYHAYDGFRTEFEKQFLRQPYVEATTRFQWDTGKGVSKQEYDELKQRLGVVRKWFNERFLTSSNSDAWTAVVTPFDADVTQYRDEPASPPSSPGGLTPELLPLIIGGPQLVIPFAQLPYQSRVSGRKEFQPVSGAVTGPPGSDLKTLHLMRQALDNAEWEFKVGTGRLAFPEAYTPSRPGSPTQAPRRPTGTIILDEPEL